MRTIIKTTYGDIVVDLNPTTPYETMQAFLRYAADGKYDGLEFSQAIAVGTNGFILFTAKTIFNEEYSVNGTVESGQQVLADIAAGENPPDGQEPNIAMILHVEYIVQT